MSAFRSVRQSRAQSFYEDWRVTTPPSRWPGVDNLVALLSREKVDDAPQLRLLLVEIFIAVSPLHAVMKLSHPSKLP